MEVVAAGMSQRDVLISSASVSGRLVFVSTPMVPALVHVQWC